MNNNSDTTHFGYEQVATGDKQQRVREVFDSVVGNYDLMNDLMSLGAHRVWKVFALARTGLRPGDVALDIAAGTGDLTAGLARQVGAEGRVFHTDINAAMLAEGNDRFLDHGLGGNIASLQLNAEQLPFAAGKMNCVTIGFGLRNVTDKQAALNEMARVIKPGGRALILEFSKPLLKRLELVYDLYSFKILPALGKLVANDAESYRYLAESIRMHPNQDELLAMMQSAGLEDCAYHNLSGGIVSLHMGFRY